MAGAIDAVAIVSRDRPAMARRAVAEALDTAARAGRAVEVVLYDDGDDAASLQSIRSIPAIADAHGAHGRHVRYAGPRQKHAYAAAVADQSGIDAAVVAFMLEGSAGFGAGANRNVVLLESCGRAVVMIDDDVLPRTVRPAPANDGTIVLSSRGYPNAVWFYDSADDVLDGVHVEPAGAFAAVERWLGRSLADAVADTPVSKSEAGPGLRRAAAEGRARLPLVQMGIAGDSGVASPILYLALTNPSRARLVSSEAAFRRGTRSRQVVAVPARTTIGEASFVMPGALALDGDTLLPPFCPRFRNENTLFSTALRKCHPSSLTAFVDVAFLHLPERPRAFDADAVWQDGSLFRVCDHVAATLGGAELASAAGPDDRLRRLGALLARTAALAIDEFAAAMEAQRRRLIEDRIRWARALLACHGASPSYWADAVERYIAELRRSLAAGHPVLPSEVRASNAREGYEQLREFMDVLGRGVSAWPALVSAAWALARQGVRPSVSIAEVRS